MEPRPMGFCHHVLCIKGGIPKIPKMTATLDLLEYSGCQIIDADMDLEELIGRILIDHQNAETVKQ